jgi:hypothetical protein
MCVGSIGRNLRPWTKLLQLAEGSMFKESRTSIPLAVSAAAAVAAAVAAAAVVSAM